MSSIDFSHRILRGGSSLSTLVFALLLLFFSSRGYADGQGGLKRVRVPIEDAQILVQVDASGKNYSGFAYEYIQTIAAYAGWEVEYVDQVGFAEALEMLKDGRADIFYDVSYSQDRAAQFLYPDQHMGTEDYYLFCLAGNKEFHVQELASLAGKRVGVLAGTTGPARLKAWCQEKGVSMEMMEYPTTQEKEEAMARGEIDLDMEISMLAHPAYSALEKISTDDYYLVVSKNRPDLLQDINDAYNKVVSIDRHLFVHLEEKYFSKATAGKTLSADEAKWVEMHKTLAVGYMNRYLPFSDSLPDGAPTGIVKDIIPVMLDNIGLGDAFQVTYQSYDSNSDMYSALESGEIDMLFPACGDISYAQKCGALFSTEVMSTSIDLAFLHSFSASKTEFIAVNRGNNLQDYYTRRYYPNARISYYSSVSECLDAVADGRVGSTLLNGMRSVQLLSPQEYDQIHVARLPNSVGFCFGVKKGNQQLLSLVNRAIANTDNATALTYSYGYSVQSSKPTVQEFLASHQVEVLIFVIVFLLIILAIAMMMNHADNKVKRKLAIANHAKTSFLFNMSHDIRTPLNAIIGFTDMAVKHIDDKARVEESLKKTGQASELLLSILNNILDMSYIEAGNIRLNEIPSDITQAFDVIKSTMGELANKKAIELAFEVEEIQDKYVFLDSVRCRRILLNVVSNAIKYTNTGGFVKVRCEQTGRRDDTHGIYRFSVVDNGIGMSEEFLKRAFDEFSREATATVSGIQGTGLGLALCKRFVERMGGTIEIISRQGMGTKITIVLPLRLQSAAEIVEYMKCHHPVTVQASDSQIDLKGSRVLLVEDNELNREVAMSILEESGMLVETANDGAVAVKLMQERGPSYFDFILMDIQMPIMNGYEATAAIRKMYPNADIPIIALSANAFAEDKAASIAAGMNDHQSKPLNAEELFASLRRLYKGKQGSSAQGVNS